MHGSASKSYLQMLNPIHNQGLCLGAFRTSPVESLYVDALEHSLGVRRAKLSLQYATKIKSFPKHARNSVFDNKCTKLSLNSSNIEFSDILETPSYFILPTWCIKPDRTNASIHQRSEM